MLRVEDFSERQVNDVMSWHRPEFCEPGDSYLTLNLHRRCQERSTADAVIRADRKEKRRGIFGMKNYVIDISDGVDNKLGQIDELKNRDDNDDNDDNDDVLSNYEKVLTSVDDSGNQSVLKPKKNFTPERRRRFEWERDIDSCYHSLRRSSTASTSSVKASLPLSGSTSDDCEITRRLSPQTIEVSKPRLKEVAAGSFHKLKPNPGKILHTKQRIHRILHPQETNNKASKCVKVKRKSSSLNKGAKKLDFHYPTVSLKSPNSSQKNPTLPPRGGNNLFENVFLPSNLDTEKALLHQPNSSHQAIPRCDSGCYPDCDISLSSLKTEELDFRITEAESLRTKENNEKPSNTEWSLWSTLRKTARRKNSSAKQNRNTTADSALHFITTKDGQEKQHLPRKNLPNTKIDSTFKEWFSSSADCLPYDDFCSPSVNLKNSSLSLNSFFVVRSTSKRSPSKTKIARRNSLPAKISPDVVQKNSSSARNNYDESKDMFVTSLYSNTSSTVKAGTSFEKVKSPDAAPRRERNIKSRIFSSFIRKKSDCSEGKKLSNKQLPSTNAAKSEINKELHGFSYQLFDFFIDPDENFRLPDGF